MSETHTRGPGSQKTTPSLTETQSYDPDYWKTNLTHREKWFIVALIALTAMFSPFTANIYFPAIPTISKAFNKPIELINLTVTVYVVLQGTSTTFAAPMIWGTMSDNLGRRPIAATCLLILAVSCVGLALVPNSAYWLLLVLRCLQSAGSSSTIAIGAGVISDISTPDERGGFYGFFSLGPMVGPAIGPVIGGALTQGLGWRSTFWFLCIAVSLSLVILILFFPETLPSRRTSTSKLRILYTPLIPIIGQALKSKDISSIVKSTSHLGSGDPNIHPRSPSNSKSANKRKFQNPLLLLLRPDIILLLVINATSFLVFFGVVTSIPPIFAETYPFLDEFRIGLCFLAMGGGMAVGSSINGKFMDWQYRIEKERLKKKLTNRGEGELEKELDRAGVKEVDKLPEFPLERARLHSLPFLVLILGACSAGYGWSLQFRVNLAVPLVLQVIMGYICMSVLNGTATLTIDLAPGQGSAVMACNNLIRCAFSAIIISAIQPIINAIGVGWTYVLIAGISLTSLPLFYLELRFGPRWRIQRRQVLVHESEANVVKELGPEQEDGNSIEHVDCVVVRSRPEEKMEV